MTTQKNDPYQTVHYFIQSKTDVSCILSQLNILCSLVKPQYTKITIYQYSPLTGYGHFTCSPTCWISSKWI